MEMSKGVAGGLSLLLCLAAYTGIRSVRTDPLPASVDSLARLYASAAPYTLITPARLGDDSVFAACSRPAIETADTPAANAANDRLAEYVTLHNTLRRRLP